MSQMGHEQTWSIAEVAKRKAARRRLLNSDLIILETTGAKTDNDTHVAKSPFVRFRRSPSGLASSIILARVRKIAGMWTVDWAVIEPIAADDWTNS